MNRLIQVVAIVSMLASTKLSAEVISSAANGFAIRHEVTIAAPQAKVFAAMSGPISAWWDPQHTYSGDARKLSLDARPGGCFCEDIGGGAGIEHMRVVYVQPERTLRMAGALGPLQPHGVSGSFTLGLKVVEGGTQLRADYSVGGFIATGFEPVSAPVDRVLGEQVQRLKRLVETGQAAAPTAIR